MDLGFHCLYKTPLLKKKKALKILQCNSLLGHRLIWIGRYIYGQAQIAVLFTTFCNGVDTMSQSVTMCTQRIYIYTVWQTVCLCHTGSHCQNLRDSVRRAIRIMPVLVWIQSIYNVFAIWECQSVCFGILHFWQLRHLEQRSESDFFFNFFFYITVNQLCNECQWHTFKKKKKEDFVSIPVADQ